MSRVFSIALLFNVWLLPSLANAQATETVRYYHTDGIGSVRAVTDENGQTVARYDYLPFGEEFPPTPDNHVPIQFAGKERDYATGFDYVGARYYASQAGRFTTVDPALDVDNALVNPQLWNRYTYSLNNPLQFTDPDGKNPVLVVGGIIWGLYEIGSSIYDAYSTYQTLRDPSASTTEKLTTGGLFVAGMLPGVPGGAATAERAAIRHTDEIVEAAAALARTPTDRLIQQSIAY
jgi:RHS repeat-associated protein